jgi:putative polyhydroxyalkanoate system protein
LPEDDARHALNIKISKPWSCLMADIHIEREHALGLHEARQIAFKWAEQAEVEFGMECTYEEGTTSDLISFSRSGVHGTLTVTTTDFHLAAKLGFLLGAFKDRIETEIVKNLDTLIDKKAASHKVATQKKSAKKKSA